MSVRCRGRPRISTDKSWPAAADSTGRDSPVLPTARLLAGVWVICDALWYLSLTAVVHATRRVFARGAVRRRLERVSGVALVGFGVRLALQSR